MVGVFLKASKDSGGSIKHFVKHEIIDSDNANEVKINRLSVYEKGCVISWIVNSYPNIKNKNLEIAVDLTPMSNCKRPSYLDVHHSIVKKITRLWDKKRFFKVSIIGIPYKDRKSNRIGFLKPLLKEFHIILRNEINFKGDLYFDLEVEP
jgi:hypothetical protein